MQQREGEGRGDDIFHVPPALAAFPRGFERVRLRRGGIGGVFVSRAERRRARGKAHDATIRQIREIDGAEVVFERKPIEKLTEADLDKFRFRRLTERSSTPRSFATNGRGATTWIEAGKPKVRTICRVRRRATSSERFGSQPQPRSASA